MVFYFFIWTAKAGSGGQQGYLYVETLETPHFAALMSSEVVTFFYFRIRYSIFDIFFHNYLSLCLRCPLLFTLQTCMKDGENFSIWTAKAGSGGMGHFFLRRKNGVPAL